MRLKYKVQSRQQQMLDLPSISFLFFLQNSLISAVRSWTLALCPGWATWQPSGSLAPQSTVPPNMQQTVSGSVLFPWLRFNYFSYNMVNF